MPNHIDELGCKGPCGEARDCAIAFRRLNSVTQCSENSNANEIGSGEVFIEQGRKRARE